jgi:hypothetical protein
MNPLKDRNFNPDTIEGEFNVVALWTKLRMSRIRAGVCAGIFAGAMMQLFGVIYCAIKGWDLLMPFKISALPILGREALAFGSVPGIVVGLIAFYTLAIVLGTAYAHFTGNNHKGVRFGIGLTWGLWGWVFITCLFSPSFQPYSEADIPRGVMFFAWLVFGISLMSVAWFDKDAK